MTSLEQLERAGFQKAGNWFADGERPRFKLEKLGEAKNILYAFVIENNPVYVGKTITQLKQRLYGYQNPGPTQPTNNRVNPLLREALKTKEIIIYALPDNDLLYFGGFHLNLAAALEDSIVKSLKPKWNVHGLK